MPTSSQLGSDSRQEVPTEQKSLLIVTLDLVQFEGLVVRSGRGREDVIQLHLENCKTVTRQKKIHGAHIYPKKCLNLQKIAF